MISIARTGSNSCVVVSQLKRQMMDLTYRKYNLIYSVTSTVKTEADSIFWIYRWGLHLYESLSCDSMLSCCLFWWNSTLSGIITLMVGSHVLFREWLWVYYRQLLMRSYRYQFSLCATLFSSNHSMSDFYHFSSSYFNQSETSIKPPHPHHYSP